MKDNLFFKKVAVFFCVIFISASLSLSVYAEKIPVETAKPADTLGPNILFIILDAARADHFSCYGYKKNTTPNIDALGRKGAIFLNHFSNATSTVESIPKIFFSRYYSMPVFQTDAWRWNVKQLKPPSIFRKFDDEQIFLTDLLSEHDYKSALFYNLGWLNEKAYLVKKFDQFFSFEVSRQHPMDEEIISSVISWVNKNKEQRFFIYCHIMSPHEPYPPKEEDNEFLKGKSPLLISKVRNSFDKMRDYSVEGWSEDELQIFKALYNGNLKHSDRWIGLLYDKLKKLDIADKTLIIITSDHAENLGEHEMLTHAGPSWDSVTHIPLVMVYPGLIPSGTKVDGLTESVDIMPTILDISKIDIPEGKSMDGVSLLGVIRDPEKAKEAVFTEGSIRTAEYKYIPRIETLYNVRNDPGEHKNIIEEQPLLRARLRAKFKQTMGPYIERYERSERKEAPNFSFYIPVDHFQLSPKIFLIQAMIKGTPPLS